ncbi:hypothetical protein CONLIGDRAFT_631797 [Coniochaeta ligniaria NRRL 30616]|uniref:Uncharacterized protein n=1 Tax=Coniochaeta ligniaria NRRL 30616 TaxID=1408157 RepID=A0A1J7IQ24_9PEZI|nr:hypothetical protein CONLIGDRAFT_631797 [Coniochaeta ligniaria NRRL 30616]
MPWGSSSARNSRHGADVTLPLPPGFVSIRDILEETIRPGTLVNVCGMVKDFRPPISTAKTGERNLSLQLPVYTGQLTLHISF